MYIFEWVDIGVDPVPCNPVRQLGKTFMCTIHLSLCLVPLQDLDGANDVSPIRVDASIYALERDNLTSAFERVQLAGIVDGGSDFKDEYVLRV